MNKPKPFMFIGIAMVLGVSLIILVTLIFNPTNRESNLTAADRHESPQQQQQCFDKYSKKSIISIMTLATLTKTKI
jgi:hypothetical protein